MSRTKRTNLLYKKHLVKYVNKELDFFYRRRMFYVGHKGHGCNCSCPRWLIRNFEEYWIELTEEDIVADAVREYKKGTRDGQNRLTSTTKSKGFRAEAKGILRRKNREFCKMVIDDEDYDNVMLPSTKLGKKFIWSWW